MLQPYVLTAQAIARHDVGFDHPPATAGSLGVWGMCTADQQTLHAVSKGFTWSISLYGGVCLQAWYFDEARYKRECSKQTMRHNANNPKSYMVHAQFQRLFRKWQAGLFKSLQACTNSPEYLQKRNALQIMSKMLMADSGTDNTGKQRPPVSPLSALAVGYLGIGDSRAQLMRQSP